jgi:hypothetical protein
MFIHSAYVAYWASVRRDSAGIVVFRRFKVKVFAGDTRPTRRILPALAFMQANPVLFTEKLRAEVARKRPYLSAHRFSF